LYLWNFKTDLFSHQRWLNCWHDFIRVLKKKHPWWHKQGHIFCQCHCRFLRPRSNDYFVRIKNLQTLMSLEPDVLKLTDSPFLLIVRYTHWVFHADISITCPYVLSLLGCAWMRVKKSACRQGDQMMLWKNQPKPFFVKTNT
jgi:hypothetical protein